MFGRWWYGVILIVVGAALVIATGGHAGVILVAGGVAGLAIATWRRR